MRSPATARRRRTRGLRIRSVLLLAVLVPVLGMTMGGIATGTEARDKRDVARQVHAEAIALAGIIDTRIAVGEEFSQATVVAVAADLGTDVDELSELYGTDYRAALATARAVVDADPVFSSHPSLAGARSQMQAFRREVDAAAVTFDEVRAMGSQVGQELVGLSDEPLLEILDLLLINDLAGTLHARAEVLEAAVEVMNAGNRRTEIAVLLVRSEPDLALLEEMLDATSRQRSSTTHLDEGFGPAVAIAVQAIDDDPAVRRFEVVLDDVAATHLAGETSPLSDDWAAFGDAFVDGSAWATALQDLVLAAAGDMKDEALRYESRASATMRDQIARTALPVGLAVIVALLLARSVSRPARRLEAAALEINHGRFALDPVPTTGPRELSDVASAFNEMAVTLAAVESNAIALADDPDAEHLADPLPGRTGRALQTALDHLRASMRTAEQDRRELEHVATHDGLTGLLNRAAAVAMIERDLAQVARAEGSVVTLFIDLDDFKAINDQYGHAAGDEALWLTAEALRASTRTADIVARFGGDEFLVAGVARGRAEVETLAARIRQAITSCDVTTPSGTTSLRCSIGMVLGRGELTTVDDLIGQADAALYEAKRLGRDRTVWVDEAQVPHLTGLA